MKQFLYFFLALLSLYNCQVLTFDTNLTAVSIGTSPTSLGITSVDLTTQNLPDNSRLTLKGTSLLSYTVEDSSEILFDISLLVDNGAVVISPHNDIVFLMGSDVHPSVVMCFEIVRSGENVILVSGSLIKGGSISEGDVRSQTVNYPAGLILGQLPFNLTLGGSSQEIGDGPTVQVQAFMSSVTN